MRDTTDMPLIFLGVREKRGGSASKSDSTNATLHIDSWKHSAHKLAFLLVKTNQTLAPVLQQKSIDKQQPPPPFFPPSLMIETDRAIKVFEKQSKVKAMLLVHTKDRELPFSQQSFCVQLSAEFVALLFTPVSLNASQITAATF